MILLKVGFEVVEFLQRFLGCGLVIPKFWLGGNLFQVLNFGSQCRYVKDSPEFYPGD
jgi:hypothetical protein